MEGISSLLFSLLISLLIFLVYLKFRFFSSPPADNLALNKQYLANKTVWITGASSGIGEALALYLCQCPSTRVVISARTVSNLQRVKQQLEAAGLSVLLLPLDLCMLATDPTLAAQLVERVLKHFGSIDIVVHNGGQSMRGAISDVAMAVDTQIININYMAAIALTKAVLPHMIAKKQGAFIVMSSVQGLLPIAYRSSYAASKHALNGFFTCLYYELRSSNIDVSVISPGYVKTNISLNALDAHGNNYGRMDDTTARGFMPAYIAGVTYSALRLKRFDVIVADTTAQFALCLQAIAPSLLHWAMFKRTEKERKKLLNNQKND